LLLFRWRWRWWWSSQPVIAKLFRWT
jgi:hypothetical protein